MMQLNKDIIAYSRACERLLSTQVPLNEEECSLLEYYLQELSRKFDCSEATIHKPAAQHAT